MQFMNLRNPRNPMNKGVSSLNVNDSSYRLPLMLATALHILLFVFLFVHFTSSGRQHIAVQPDVDIIKAVAVSPEQIAQIARAKAEQQRLLELKHQQEAAAKAEALRKQQELMKQQQEQARQ